MVEYVLFVVKDLRKLKEKFIVQKNVESLFSMLDIQLLTK
jgi:hypothetical protein